MQRMHCGIGKGLGEADDTRLCLPLVEECKHRIVPFFGGL